MLFKVLRLLFRLMYRVEIRGDTRLLTQPRVMLTPNHVSFLYGILLAVFLPVKPVFAIYTTLDDAWFMPIIRRYADIISLNATRPHSIKQLIKAVGQGRPVVVFPEGRLTVTGTLMKVYDGAAFVAARADSLVVPMWIDGPESTPFSRMGGVFRRRWFPQITLTLLAPTPLPMPEGRRADGERLRTIMMNARMASRPAMTLYDGLLQAMRRYGDSKPCITDMALKTDSYHDLLRKSLGISRILQRLTAPGEHVGFLLPNATIMV
ncbi:1-acyl-sn-glycerol-3-phosphate acyltransferase, partial [Sodalis glossinidius]|uniref:1-acyl-sn-glycerol-3-phosphate acyltransferase n=1 Tax=Sodalis glossinidius TaxID=63612 RepID=UPI0002E3EC1F